MHLKIQPDVRAEPLGDHIVRGGWRMGRRDHYIWVPANDRDNPQYADHAADLENGFTWWYKRDWVFSSRPVRRGGRR